MLQWWIHKQWCAEAYAEALARIDLALGLIGATLVAFALAAW